MLWKNGINYKIRTKTWFERHQRLWSNCSRCGNEIENERGKRRRKKRTGEGIWMETFSRLEIRFNHDDTRDFGNARDFLAFLRFVVLWRASGCFHPDYRKLRVTTKDVAVFGVRTSREEPFQIGSKNQITITNHRMVTTGSGCNSDHNLSIWSRWSKNASKNKKYNEMIVIWFVKWLKDYLWITNV